jgi:hypothetical protein
MVAATEQAWRWIDRLGVPGPNPAEPLPPYVYVLATHVAASPERRSARVRVRAADGTWAVIRAAALTTGPQVPAGYAVTLEAAPADDLAPLLMRAWRLTRREREVARLVIDGGSGPDRAGGDRRENAGTGNTEVSGVRRPSGWLGSPVSGQATPGLKWTFCLASQSSAGSFTRVRKKSSTCRIASVNRSRLTGLVMYALACNW